MAKKEKDRQPRFVVEDELEAFAEQRGVSVKALIAMATLAYVQEQNIPSSELFNSRYADKVADDTEHRPDHPDEIAAARERDQAEAAARSEAAQEGRREKAEAARGGRPVGDNK